MTLNSNIFQAICCDSSYGGSYLDPESNAKDRLLSHGFNVANEETRTEIMQLFKELKESHGSPEYNFFIQLIQTPIGEKLFTACFEAISQIEYTGYIFTKARIFSENNPQYHGKFSFKVGYKSIFIEEMYLSLGADSRLRDQTKDIIDKTIQDDIIDLFNQAEVVPLIVEHEKEIKKLGDVDNVFVALLDEKKNNGRVKNRTLKLCSSRISKWLSSQFCRSEALVDKTKEVIRQAQDDMRSTTFSEKRNDEHRKHMVSRVCGILRENPGLAKTVTEQALDEITMEMIMDA